MAARSPRPRMPVTSSSAPKTATAFSAPAAWNACRPKSRSPTRPANSRPSSSKAEPRRTRRKGKSKRTGSGEKRSLVHNPFRRKLAAKVNEQLARSYPRLAFPRFFFPLCPPCPPWFMGLNSVGGLEYDQCISKCGDRCAGGQGLGAGAGLQRTAEVAPGDRKIGYRRRAAGRPRRLRAPLYPQEGWRVAARKTADALGFGPGADLQHPGFADAGRELRGDHARHSGHGGQ